MAETTGARMQHDVGADFKVPLPTFSGRNDDWPVWSARFGAYAELAGLDRDARGGRSANSANHEVGAMRFDWATSSMLVLLMKTEGKAFSMVHLTARGAGAEVRLGGFYTQNTRDLLEHVWETWHVMWRA